MASLGHPASQVAPASLALTPALREQRESLVRAAFLVVPASLARQDRERRGQVADRAIRGLQEHQEYRQALVGLF